MNFEKQAVVCIFMNGKSATATLNNHKWNQGDRGYDPIRLAAFLNSFLEANGFQVQVNELSPSIRYCDNMQFPRRTATVSNFTEAKKVKLVALIKRFNELFDDSETYADFETKLNDETKPKPKPTKPLSSNAEPYVPAKSVVATTPESTDIPSATTNACNEFTKVISKKKNVAAAFASSTVPSYAKIAKQDVDTVPATTTHVPSGSAAVPNTAPVPPNETAYQRLKRLKDEQEYIIKRQIEIQEAIKMAEAAVKQNNAKSLENIIAFAKDRGEEFLKDLVRAIQIRVDKPTAAAAATPIQADGASAVDKSQRQKKDKKTFKNEKDSGVAAAPVQAATSAANTNGDGVDAKATASALWSDEPYYP